MSDPTSALRGALTAPVVQHRAAIIEPVAFGALLRAVDGYDGTLVVRSALQLLALTFTRPGELRLAAWKEFDLDAGVWTIPANRMKMRRPHRVPLAPQTIAILEELRTLTGRYELLFPTRALTLAAAIGKHAQCSFTTARIRQERNVQPWLPGSGLFASQRM